MKKKSAYQKLKDKNALLQQHIYALIKKPDEYNTTIIRQQYLLTYQLSETVWTGTATYDKFNIRFDGLIKQISLK